MAGAALFVGWGPVVPGREQKSLQVFNEGVAYWQQLQQQGDIDSFEVVALEPHGGELNGFVLMHGDREKLDRVRYSEEFQRLNARAGLVVQNLGVVAGFTGDALNSLFADFQAQATELA